MVRVRVVEYHHATVLRIRTRDRTTWESLNIRNFSWNNFDTNYEVSQIFSFEKPKCTKAIFEMCDTGSHM